VSTRANSTNPLLLSRRSPVVHTEPFVFLEVDDFLPPVIYEEAVSAFPSGDWFPQRIEGNKLRFSLSQTPKLVGQLASQHPVWRQIIDWLQDPVFLDDLYDVVADGLALSRGQRAARRWTFGVRGMPWRSMRHLRATTDFEFSRLEPGAFVPPHTDYAEKLVSALLYFPEPAWKEEYGGHTVYYRAKDDATLDANWDNARLDTNALEQVHTNTFEPNHLSIFLKSANSHHAVSPVACPPGSARNSLNFNVLTQRGDMARAARRGRIIAAAGYLRARRTIVRR
jgi:hypothetical protein